MLHLWANEIKDRARRPRHLEKNWAKALHCPGVSLHAQGVEARAKEASD